ncbi:MAG: glycosyltransferase [Bacteroidales bacterium]|nr:glycosyltransferase [Bacteroidales bacterium]
MKIIIIFPHLSSNEKDEHLTYERAIREQFISESLRDIYDIQLWFLTSKSFSFSFFNSSGYPTYFPIDKIKHFKKSKWHVSNTLKNALILAKPDIVIFKGLGYYLPYWLYKNKTLPNKIGFIVGGNTFDILLPVASYIFSEFNYQIQNNYKIFSIKGICSKLGKYIPDKDFILTDNKDFDIISIGDLSRRKNHIALLPLAQKWKILIIGDGPLKNDLLEKFKPYEHNVHFIGSLNRNKIAQYISKSKIMVHPSLSEGFPRVFAESFACGVPVITFKKAIKGEFPDNKVGKLVNDADLEEYVEYVLTNNKFRNEISRNAFEYANNEFRGTVIKQQFQNGIITLSNHTNITSIYSLKYKIITKFYYFYWYIDYYFYKLLSNSKRFIISFFKGTR